MKAAPRIVATRKHQVGGQIVRHFLSAAIATLAIASPAGAADQIGEPSSVTLAPMGPGVELSTGIEHQDGTFGTAQKVATTSVPTSVRVATGRFQFTATLPYLRVDAPGNAVGGGGLFGLPIIVDPSQPAARVRREGLGHVRLGASYRVPLSGVGLTLMGQVKVPTASQRKKIGDRQARLFDGRRAGEKLWPLHALRRNGAHAARQVGAPGSATLSGAAF